MLVVFFVVVVVEEEEEEAGWGDSDRAGGVLLVVEAGCSVRLGSFHTQRSQGCFLAPMVVVVAAVCCCSFIIIRSFDRILGCGNKDGAGTAKPSTTHVTVESLRIVLVVVDASRNKRGRRMLSKIIFVGRLRGPLTALSLLRC